jgi:hypothetical protein
LNNIQSGARMTRKKIRKRLIDPKVRLLLLVYLYGIKDESNWLTKLSGKIDYSEGSTQTQLIDLLNKNLIVTLDPNNGGPPYKITEDGKKFLQPILFTQKIGMAMTIWVSLWTVIDYIFYLNQPVLMLVSWLPLLIVSFVILALVLIFYPQMLLRLGKIGY